MKIYQSNARWKKAALETNRSFSLGFFQVDHALKPNALPAARTGVLRDAGRDSSRCRRPDPDPGAALCLFEPRHLTWRGDAVAHRLADWQLHQYSGGAFARAYRRDRTGGEFLRHALRGAGGGAMAG